MAISENTSTPLTFVQDEQEPIYITIEYDRGDLTFPVNPEMLKQVIASPSVTENIESIGEISIPQRPSLTEMTFNSFFWNALNDDKNKPEQYIEWLKRWQKSKKPAHLIVSKYKWLNMDVTCESLSYWVNAGEEKDIYFEITLKEYKEHRAEYVKIVNANAVDSSSLQAILGKAETFEETERLTPVIFERYKTTRSNINKIPTPTIIKSKNDDSIVAVVRRSTNDTSQWTYIYENNKEAVSSMALDRVVTADIPLETPKSWNPTQYIPNTPFSLEKALKKAKTMSTIFKKLDEISHIFDSIKSAIESVQQSEGAMKMFLTKCQELYMIFTPDNSLDTINSIKMALEDLKAIAGFPEEVVGSLDKMIAICVDMWNLGKEFVTQGW